MTSAEEHKELLGLCQMHTYLSDARPSAQLSFAKTADLQGLLGTPAQFLPMTVPNRHRGREMNIQMSSRTTMLPKGTCRNRHHNWL